MNQIPLRGCAPEPLIHYLKALGILRLVAEQLDPQARAAWDGDTFMLETEKTKEDLVDFFLNDYRPTPLMSPWNGGSGFGEGEDITGREAIRSSSGERLEIYRAAINDVLSLPELPSVGHLTVTDFLNRIEQAITESKNQEGKDVADWKNLISSARNELIKFPNAKDLAKSTLESIEEIKGSIGDKAEKKNYSELFKVLSKVRNVVKKFKRAAGKDDIIKACRNRLSDETIEWFDAAVVLFENESGEVPLLGAGGIDGKLEFARNFMSRLSSVIPELLKMEVAAKKQKDLNKNAQNPANIEKINKQIAEQIKLQVNESEQNLKACLFAECSPILENAAVGQFQPSGAGGAPNASHTPKIDSGEGMVNPWDFILALEGSLMLASATVRQLAAGARSKASFPFTVHNSNIGYGTATDNEKVRAEIWLPLWSRFTGYAEIAHIFKEGRVQFSDGKGRIKAVRTGFDFARAIAELGVDRGIDAFQRYAFIERNGQANLATPLGVFEVRERPLVSLIHQLDRGRWLDFFTRASSDEKKTPRFARARKRIEEAIFRLCATGSPERLREVLIALGAAEAELANGEKFRDEAKKKNMELRPLKDLSLRWVHECNDHSDEFKIAASLAAISGAGKVGSLRNNIEPFDSATRNWSQRSTSAIWSAAALEENLAAVLQRRSIDARSQSLSHPPLASSRFASLKAVDAFLKRETNDEKIEDLLRGLILIDWTNAEPFESKSETRAVPPTLSRAYALLKLLFLPEGKFQPKPDAETIIIKHEPSIILLLRAGRVSDALDVAARRLRASGVMPLTTDFYLQEEDGVRLAAALLIPIDEPSRRAVARLVLGDETED
jgi:CRISPR-associated protein Csx17